MNNPLVSIIMGSDSDLAVMIEAAKVMEDFNVPYETHIISAHRNPEGLTEQIKIDTSRGTKVFIASAGLAAHLPGVIAAQTTLPVIGVPIKAKSSPEGLDALLSIAQMPPGVPVATVAINGAKNAGLLAIQILAIENKALQEKISAFKKNMKQAVEKKSEELKKLGIKEYLEKIKK